MSQTRPMPVLRARICGGVQPRLDGLAAAETVRSRPGDGRHRRILEFGRRRVVRPPSLAMLMPTISVRDLRRQRSVEDGEGAARTIVFSSGAAVSSARVAGGVDVWPTVGIAER